jgi:GlpG protein
MRKLVSFENAAFAEALSEVLQASQIANEVRSAADASHAVWIMTESDVDRARGVLEAFVADPERELKAATEAVSAARAQSPQPEPDSAAARSLPLRRATLRERFINSPVSMLIALACIGVALATRLGADAHWLQYLSIVSFEQIGAMRRWNGYDDLLHGQVWRLFTPILIHFGPFHLLFNLFWLNDLGAATERYQGSWRYVGFVLFTAAVSNLAQLQFGHNPSFGGLSGVIYAVVGYLWARGRADPQSGIRMPPRLVGFFVIWLALGFSGLLSDLFGHMANYCHLGGFASGALYGYIAALGATRRARS